MFKNKFSKMKKVVVAISLLFLFLVPIISGTLLFAKPAYGQWSVTEPVLDADTARRIAEEQAAEAYENAQSVWYVALLNAVMNAVSYFANKIAYDFAVAIATASPGQTPSFFTQDWETYLTDTALDSAGEAIGSLADIWSATDEVGTCANPSGKECTNNFDCDWGPTCTSDADCASGSRCQATADGAGSQCQPVCLKESLSSMTASAGQAGEIPMSMLGWNNICAPPNPQIRLDLMLGLSAQSQPPVPKCEWANIQSQWETFIEEASTGEILNRISVQFHPGGGSDLDIALQSQSLLAEQTAQAEQTAEQTRTEGQGFKPLTETISTDFFKSPAQSIKDQAMAAYDSKETSKEEKGQAISQATSPGAVLKANAIGMLKGILGTFINTLSSQLMNRVMQEGIVSLKDIKDWFSSDDDVLSSPEFAGLAGRKTAEVAYADFITPRPKEMGDYSTIIELSSCPQGAAIKAPENCSIDAQFAQAVNQATMGDPLTVGQAVSEDKGLLHGNWPLIRPDDIRNDKSNCYQIGYCYSNLVKLRKARIIPIGWEIAASFSNGTNTLKEAIDNFDNCNSQGMADSDHKWCHLIDPSWVLKAPSFQCRAKVYGAAATNGGMRQEVCVDAPSCLNENDQGNCDGGYGYCVKEKNIWRLQGDRCDAQFDSCRALRSRTGDVKSFLINTVDYGPPCTSDDVGCRWYSTRQAKVGDEWIWQDATSGTPAQKTDRIYFNKNVTQCNEGGCSRFYKTSVGTSLNLLQNSSFETIVGEAGDSTGDTFGNWLNYAGSVASGLASEDAYSGRVSLQVTGSLRQNIETGQSLGGKTFVLSLYVKNCGGRAFFSSTPYGTGERSTDVSLVTSGTNWERKTAFLGFPLTTARTALSVHLEGTGSGCLIDGVQLEEASEPAEYHEGLAGQGQEVVMKKAPDYLMCYTYNPDGTVKTSDDAPDCGNYAAACQENEAGCERYTPVNGGTAIPGIATYPEDYCRAECVGYQTFKQLKTNFETDKFPVFFIPKTARSCSAVEAGCDEFTSLETEAIENYSYLRQCQKPGADEETFYTWEGSDTTGYQLKTWILKISNQTIAASSDPFATDPDGGTPPCTKLAPDGTTCADEVDAGTGFAVGDGICSKASTIMGVGAYNPDCREFYDTAGHRHYRLYSKTIVVTDDCHPYRKTLSTEPDCAASGGKWDGTRSECTYLVYPAESRSCSAVGCRAYRGNSGANVRNVFQNSFDVDLNGWTGGEHSSESLQTGGHSMKVTGGTAVTKPVGDQIQKGGVYLISFWARAEGAPRAEVYFANSNVSPAEKRTPSLFADLSLTWQPYTVGPIEITWDPAEPDMTLSKDGETLNITLPSGVRAYFDNFTLKQVSSNIYLVKDSWVTPVSCDTTAFGGYLPQAMLGCEEYRDRSNRQHFLKSFTSLCREEAIGCQKLVDTKNTESPYRETFNAVCQYVFGMTDATCDSAHGLPAGQNTCDCKVNNAKVCSVPVGQGTCRYDTTDQPMVVAEDTVVTPADSYAFMIVDDTKSCNKANVGCTSYGAPKLDSSGSIICTMADGPDAGTDPDVCSTLIPSGATVAPPCDCKRDGEVMCKVLPGNTYCTGGFETVNFLNDVTRYSGQNRILCEAQYQSCEEYTGSNSAKYYFKDPGKRTCSWKENVSYGGEQRSGWFRKDDDGKDVPCYADYSSAGIFGIWKNADVAYDKWVGNCPAEQNMCTKFVDPADTSGENPEGTPYYYIKNNKLSSGECNGQVSLQEGCVLFEDTSNPNNFYNAGISYFNSETGVGGAPRGSKVTPVDCNQTGCQRCGGTCVDGDYCLNPPYCAADSDCARGLTCRVYPVGDLATANNANTILKVRRDRVCGEWLACKTSTTNFDPMTAKKKEICDGLGLCSQFTKIGQASACTSWVDEAEEAKILDLRTYTSREIGWAGQDYSGYAVPNEWPAYKLSQINVAEPNKTAVWRLAYVEEEKCFDNGSVPPSGTAYESLPAPPPLSDPPVADTPLTRVRECGPSGGGPASEVAGTCYAQNGKLCVVPASGTTPARTGKCYNYKCAYDVLGNPTDSALGIIGSFAEGKPLEVASTNFAPLCRAYPENNSPYPYRVAHPERKQGFYTANVCEKQMVCVGGADDGKFCLTDDNCGGVCVGGTNDGDVCNDPGDCGGTGATCEMGSCSEELPNACECSYKKISYGGTAKYFNKEVNPAEGDAPEAVCVGGGEDVIGIPCTPSKCPSPDDATCECGQTGKAGTGFCTAIQKVDTVLGQEGYCLERDKTTSINGSSEENFCLTWLPVDRLMGSPDIYNQYINAGYAPGARGQMCLQADIFIRPRPVWGCVSSAYLDGEELDQSCDYNDIYDVDAYCEWNRGTCVSGNAAPSTCERCPTGWTYIEAGCAPEDNSTYCGDLVGGYSDGCIYWCIPPGPLVNNNGTSGLGDDTSVPAWDQTKATASVCWPDRARNGKFTDKDGAWPTADDADTFKKFRGSPGEYCEADYFVTYLEYRAALAGKNYVYNLDILRSDSDSVRYPTPTFYPGCSMLTDISGQNANISQAWTDRLYENQNTGWCRAGKCTNSAGLCRTGAGGHKYCANDPTGPPCSSDNDCSCSSDADCDFRIISDVGAPASSSDLRWLNYIYGSDRDPFGYAVETQRTVGRSSGSAPEGPISIPYCNNPPTMSLTEAATTSCLGGEKVGVEDSRPYMNFDYTARKACDSDAACNPDAECNGSGSSYMCWTSCTIGHDETCPLKVLPGRPDEHYKCANVGGVGVCMGSEVTGPDIACNPDDISHSPCETSAGGRCVGTCTNAAGMCRADSDCYAVRCKADILLGGNYCDQLWSLEVMSQTDNEGWDKRSLGAERVAQLFAKSWGFWIWNSRSLSSRDPGDWGEYGGYGDSNRYLWSTSGTNFNTLAWDITETGGVGEAGFPAGAAIRPTPPMIAPIKNPCIGDKCGVLLEGGRPVKGITVNDQSSGTVISRSGDLKADIKFFAWADKNQMPIKQICVDFAGDGSVLSSGCGSSDNFFKNYRGWKEGGSGESECDGTDFSRASQSCTEDFYNVSTTYTCVRDIGPNWNPTCPDSTVAGGCCVFNPRVMVKDNWDWCNGTCSGLRPNGGCYKDQCWPPESSEPHWTSFSGRVIVVPE